MFLALLAGVSLALAYEPVAAAFLIPFAVTGFALTTRGLRARSGWLPGLAFGMGFYYVHLYWMRAVGVDAWLALAGAESVFYAILGSVSAVLHGRKHWPLWLATAWVAVEVWRSGWPFGGLPWGRLAFGTVDTPAAESLAYVGMTGVSFLLALCGSLLAWALVARERERRVAVGVFLAATAMLLVPSVASYTPTQEDTAVVAAVQGNVPGDGDDILLDFRQVTENHVQGTVELSERVAAGTEERPDFVVWPENSTAVDPFRDQTTNEGIRRASAAIGVPILVGAIVDAGEDNVLNQGIVWDPVSGAADRYTKWHPVPYGEYIPFRRYFEGTFGRLALVPRDMLSGTRDEPLEVAGIRVADAICFDVGYDDGIHAQIHKGAELLTVQTSNATFIKTDQIDQQFAISRLRAIETGRWVIVAATNGVSGVIAPDGSVVASAAPRTSEVLVERVGLTSSVTPGVRVGPWVGQGCLLLTGVALLVGLITARRRAVAGSKAPSPDLPPAEGPVAVGGPPAQTGEDP